MPATTAPAVFTCRGGRERFLISNTKMEHRRAAAQWQRALCEAGGRRQAGDLHAKTRSIITTCCTTVSSYVGHVGVEQVSVSTIFCVSV